MTTTARSFNLVDDPWIPAGAELVGLRGVFSGETPNLDGTPVEKTALLKLLTAIAQSACTPEDDAAWEALGPDGISAACSAYLEAHRDAFYLYGERPFLQFPQADKAKVQPPGALLPHVATGNTTILQDLQKERPLSDAEKALLLVCVSGFALGGKKADNTVVLTSGYTEKSKESGKGVSGKAGAWLGSAGYLHHFLWGENLPQTVWMNLLTHEDIRHLSMFREGLGTAPWERMPEGEACPTALKLRDSLMGRLVPLSKFCLLDGDGIHYTDGIAHAAPNDGGVDPSTAVLRDASTVRCLWTNPDRQPWRNLDALLAFLGGRGGFDCPGIRACLARAARNVPVVGLWAGGLKVSSNAGEQYVSGGDDFVDGLLFLPADATGEFWYHALQREMDALNALGRQVYAVTGAYHASTVQKHGAGAGRDKGEGDKAARRATQIFWELCGRESQTLIDLCADAERIPELRRRFAAFALRAYNAVCPRDTARQLESWAENRPRTGKYCNA
jgi:CRISPR system Cascade subunit CasA